MTLVNLPETARTLPEVWRSVPVTRIANAQLKVERMSGLPLPEESHPTPEALLVLEGRLELSVAGRPVTVRAGEVYTVPAGTVHAVRPGSEGILVILAPAPEEPAGPPR
ncbi:cupin domain-containing protein [Streptomyces sp. NPDC052396]|uniref:cupin domain-containing protein n=1 Tax=Streptomyces sp. NPDC052396 TaxID=3365689 RepID=UPI0037D95FF1